MQKQVETVALLLEEKIEAASAWSVLSKIKNVYRGDPLIINQSSLPALIVRTPNAQVTARDNNRDTRVYNMQIRYVYNIRDKMGNPNQKNNAFEVDANNMFIAEVDANGCLSDDCIVKILRDDEAIRAIGKIQTNFSVIWEYTDVRGYLSFESSLNFDIIQIGCR